MSDVFTLMVEGPNGTTGGIVLPIALGALGADVLYVGRVLDGSGDVAVASITSNCGAFASPWGSTSLISFPDETDYSGELWQVVLRTPGSPHAASSV